MQILPTVIFEQDGYMAINKPAGWVVNDSKTAHGNPTLQDFIKNNFDFSISKNFELRNGIVHRLDKDTSGVILVAKDKENFEYLQLQFAQRKVPKEYLALVHGISDKVGRVSGKIGRLKKNRMRFGVVPYGRDAETMYMRESVHAWGGNKYSLLRLTPKTGRTHQIRVHLSHIGHSIVSDNLYADKAFLKQDQEFCKRMFLHASKIQFVDHMGKTVTIEAPLPPDLTSALQSIK